jgi:hypothetical protein
MRFWREGTKDSLSNSSAHFPRRSFLLPVDFMAPLKGNFWDSTKRKRPYQNIF